jgi:hypothetical protein
LDHQQRQEGWSEEAHDELGACILLSYGFDEVVEIAVIWFEFYELKKASPPKLLCVWEVGSLDFGGFRVVFCGERGMGEGQARWKRRGRT